MKETLIFLGDSNVDAGRLWEECADGLGFGFVAELAGKLPEEKFALINRGHYGFTVRDVWRNLPHAGEEASGSAPLLPGEEKDSGKRESGASAAAPATVTVLAGVNNIPMYFYEDRSTLPASFREDYSRLLGRIRELWPEAGVILAEPFVFRRPEEFISWRPLLEQESRVIRELAALHGAEFLPLQECMDRAAEQYGMDAVTPDGLHLTAISSRLLAERWLEVFQKKAR